MRSKVSLQNTNEKTETDHINYLQLGVSLHLTLNDFKRAYYKCTNLCCPKPDGSSISPKLHLKQVSDPLTHPIFTLTPVSFCMDEMTKVSTERRKKQII